MSTRRYAVVGGGITGLAAAWELTRIAPDDEIVVYEPGALGGKLRTGRFAGRLVDEGADAFLARVPWGRELCDELGLGDELVSPATPVAYVAAGTALHRLPPGLVLGVPTDPDALRGSPLVGPEAVERVAAEPALPGAPLAAGEDPSIGALVRSRLGDDILEHLVDPLLGGINAGDSDRLSVRAAAPQLAAAAERSASLVAGLRAAPPPDDPTAPVFWALPGGMSALVETLVGALADAGVAFTSEAVVDCRDLGADGVVLAAPAAATAGIVERAGAADAAALLRNLGHSSPVLTTLAFARADVEHPLDGSGFLVPRREGRFVTACSFATTKWSHLGTADATTVVLRASAGRYGDDRAIDLDDDALLAATLADLDDLLSLKGEATEVRISRWRDGFPQYEPGHLERVAAIEADVAHHLPGVAVAGASYRGLGIPACIRQGRQASGQVAVKFP